MTNSDDIFAEFAFLRERILKHDYEGALEACDQAIKLWAAERDYWALISLEVDK